MCVSSCRLNKDWIVWDVRLIKATNEGHCVPLFEVNVLSRATRLKRHVLHCCARCFKDHDRLHNAAQHASTCRSFVMADLLRPGGALLFFFWWWGIMLYSSARATYSFPQRLRSKSVQHLEQQDKSGGNLWYLARKQGCLQTRKRGG